MSKLNCIAVDFGASSGRLILGKYDGNRIDLEEIHRFPNEPIKINHNRYYWDFLRLFHELKVGLQKIATCNIDVLSMGIDTWGVDYGLVDKNGDLISNPFHYRDKRTDKIDKELAKKIGVERLYKTTGIQLMSINTICQLYADKKERPYVLDNAESLLFTPDLFNYFLTGIKYNEYTIASTSQLLNAQKRSWSQEIINELGVSKDIFVDIIPPCSIIGNLKKDIQEEVGLDLIKIIAVGSHDTASAVAATPLDSRGSAYLSSGTWSLLGIESNSPIINKESMEGKFTNEGGLENKFRFLKNITGLWIIQQIKKELEEENMGIGFAEISKLASDAKKSSFIINPNADEFFAPISMQDAIVNYCKKTGQGTPCGIGEIARAAYNGLAKVYKETIEQIEKVAGIDINAINMVGGGTQDRFLCQLTADVTGKKVIAGPIEASTLGNILAQLLALGEIKNLDEGRDIIRRSFETKVY